ncbi:hypothetical protein C8J56DRAFT_1062387 [Mycena floridula]|nr:hypothetical protein C8J56DRAFT_1062387 [Mycena floridula]
MPRTTRYPVSESGYKCEFCPTVLAHPRDMNRHLKLHVENKKHLMHSCSFPGCRFQSLQPGNVQIHIAAIHGLQRYHCPDCGLSTSHPSSLIRHRKRKHGYCPQPRRARNSPGVIPDASSSSASGPFDTDTESLSIPEESGPPRLPSFSTLAADVDAIYGWNFS